MNYNQEITVDLKIFDLKRDLLEISVTRKI